MRWRPACEKESTLTTGPSRYSSAMTAEVSASWSACQAVSASSGPSTGWMCRLATPSTGLTMIRSPTSARNAAISSALFTSR